jgi:arsenate reductase (thioredoxin)
MKILVLCTGNSCRSQMAEGFLKSFDSTIVAFSAGTHPADKVHDKAIQVMQEVGIDLSANYPKSVDKFLDEEFDFVITVCGGAQESCPAFHGNVKNRLHLGFDDPADAKGTPDEILNEFRRVRNLIKNVFEDFYNDSIKQI